METGKTRGKRGALVDTGCAGCPISNILPIPEGSQNWRDAKPYFLLQKTKEVRDSLPAPYRYTKGMSSKFPHAFGIHLVLTMLQDLC